MFPNNALWVQNYKFYHAYICIFQLAWLEQPQSSRQGPGIGQWYRLKLQHCPWARLMLIAWFLSWLFLILWRTKGMLVRFISRIVLFSLCYAPKTYIKYNYTFFVYVCEDFCFHNCVIRHLNKCQLINFVKVQHYFLCGDCVLNKYVRMILFHGY